MRKLSSYAEEVMLTVRGLKLSPDQEVEVLGMAARLLCQQHAYGARHVSPVGHARRSLNAGFDKGARDMTARDL